MPQASDSRDTTREVQFLDPPRDSVIATFAAANAVDRGQSKYQNLPVAIQETQIGWKEYPAVPLVTYPYFRVFGFKIYKRWKDSIQIYESCVRYTKTKVTDQAESMYYVPNRKDTIEMKIVNRDAFVVAGYFKRGEILPKEAEVAYSLEGEDGKHVEVALLRAFKKVRGWRSFVSLRKPKAFGIYKVSSPILAH